MKKKNQFFNLIGRNTIYILMIGENQRHIDGPICIQHSEYLKKKKFDFDVHYIHWNEIHCQRHVWIKDYKWRDTWFYIIRMIEK